MSSNSIAARVVSAQGGPVEDWFGEAFLELHPLIQRLHREGGNLGGTVEMSFGRGIAGALGRRLASRMGVPATSGAHHLQVTLRSDAGGLHWGRRFNGRDRFDSRFVPHGRYPTGHWLEQSGPLKLALGVEIRDGGWHWLHRSTHLLGVRVPKALFPAVTASKRIEGSLYRFSVHVKAPLLGKLFEYSGMLSPC